MVAADENLSQRAAASYYLIRIRAVTDRVAQIDDEVMSRSRREARLERFQITVNIAEEKDAHKARIIALPSNFRDWFPED